MSIPKKGDFVVFVGASSLFSGKLKGEVLEHDKYYNRFRIRWLNSLGHIAKDTEGRHEFPGNYEVIARSVTAKDSVLNILDD